MAEYTKTDALTFIDSMRILLGNRTGFHWMIEKLSDLAAYVESIAAENERLHACLDSERERDGVPV